MYHTILEDTWPKNEMFKKNYIFGLTLVFTVSAGEAASASAFSVDAGATIQAFTWAVLGFPICHVEICTLMNLSTWNSPLKLEYACITCEIFGETELLTLVSDFSAAGEWAIFVGTAVSWLDHCELILVEALTHTHCAVTILRRVSYLPLNEVSATWHGHVMSESPWGTSTWWWVGDWSIRECPWFGIYQCELGSINAFLCSSFVFSEDLIRCLVSLWLVVLIIKVTIKLGIISNDYGVITRRTSRCVGCLHNDSLLTGLMMNICFLIFFIVRGFFVILLLCFMMCSCSGIYKNIKIYLFMCLLCILLAYLCE